MNSSGVYQTSTLAQIHYPSDDQKRCKTGATASGASAIQQ
jgi:hypothetical protein